MLVNNAVINAHKKAMDVTPEDFHFIVRVNSKGIQICCQEAARHSTDLQLRGTKN